MNSIRLAFGAIAICLAGLYFAADSIGQTLDAAAVSRGTAKSLAQSGWNKQPFGWTSAVRYPKNRTLSPITPQVVSTLRAAASRSARNEHVFVKVGASASRNRNFLRCFSGKAVDLGGQNYLKETIAFFRKRPNPFARKSRSTFDGWHAGLALEGGPPPLIQELRAMNPRYAVIMYGTNDMQYGRPIRYARFMMNLTDRLLRLGVVPLLTTVMPRDDDPKADAELVPLYNEIIRGVAQGRQLPLVDFHRELARLDGHGLAGDGVHPNVFRPQRQARGCVFSAEALKHGYNVRNLITLQTLHRVRKVLDEGAKALDKPTAPLKGEGSFRLPFKVTSLPFSDVGNTARSPHRARNHYRCSPRHNEGGPEVVYELPIPEKMHIQAFVAERPPVDVDLQLLRRTKDGWTCAQRHDRELDLTLEAGRWAISVDTFVGSRGKGGAGEYLFVVNRLPLNESS